MQSILEIPLDQIDATDRLRPIDDSWAAAISESMDELGLTEPVIVRATGASYILVAGGHRFRAAQMLGWAEIPAIVQEINGLQARLVEIDENLMRRELGALDRAVFMFQRKAVWEELYPETAHGKAKKSKDSDAQGKDGNLPSFVTEVSSKVGVSKTTIERACRIAAGMAPEIVALVRNTYLATHQGDLEKLARMPVERQRQALEGLASGEFKTLAGAFGRTQRDPEEVMVQRGIDLWNRAPARARRRMLTYFGVSPREVEQIINPRGLKEEAA